ncbi:hypothetical protein PBY51_019309 [Eleginops maclovinus]|uniref:Uncharacterized protein n=1 Tax=Eleginops maclovinus TaxID=56733 RepID=A0AAN7YCQ7_ELEMC|nr:hypothetical protein PBY51_019309 [Eleginops maclovinus]
MHTSKTRFQEWLADGVAIAMASCLRGFHWKIAWIQTKAWLLISMKPSRCSLLMLPVDLKPQHKSTDLSGNGVMMWHFSSSPLTQISSFMSTV